MRAIQSHLQSNREVAQAWAHCSWPGLMTEHTSGALICYRLTLVAWHEWHFTHCSARAVLQTQGHILSRVLLLGQQPMCKEQITRRKWKYCHFIKFPLHTMNMHNSKGTPHFSSMIKTVNCMWEAHLSKIDIHSTEKSLPMSDSMFTINYKCTVNNRRSSCFVYVLQLVLWFGDLEHSQNGITSSQNNPLPMTEINV